MKLIIASNNKHKIYEIKKILADKFDEIYSLSEAGIVHETVEDGDSFMANAEKKAREIAEISGECALADDSGICIDALDGAPGIFSARFSGLHGDDEQNNRLVLQKLDGVDNRGAYYACAMSLVYPDGKAVGAMGYLYGSIAKSPVGDRGFGYDPLFIPEGETRTVAQMTDEEKNAISHRGRALAALLEKL